MTLKSIGKKIDRFEREYAVIQKKAEPPQYLEYQGDPVGYAKDVLKVEFIWDKVADIMRAIHTPPYRVLVKSGHKVGKSASAGFLINYWFDCFDPGVVITTGASYEAMCDTVWSEVRMQRVRANLPDLFIGPAAPEMRTSPEHWAKLISVNKAESFQGKHRGRAMFLYDEACGIDQSMFTIAKTMFKPEPGFAWVCFYNPTEPSSPVYLEEQSGKWQVFSLSSLEHPNIEAQIKARRLGKELISSELPIPNAISISQIDDWVKDWCLPIDERSAVATDFQWLEKNGTCRWWRPQMDWESRCTGNWPTQATSSVWSDHLFTVCAKARGAVPIHELPQIGCDVARFGDDRTAVHRRWGVVSLAHESRQGLRVTETAGWLIEVANEMAKMVTHMRKEERNHRLSVTGQQIPIKVDDDGVGAGVVDILFERGYNAIPVHAATLATDPTRYPNKRSELWFNTARLALDSGIALSRLDPETLQRIKLQAVAPTWKMDSAGRRVVEPKADTKKRLNRSPDDMDALNLAYYEIGFDVPEAIDLPLYEGGRALPTSEAYREEGPRGDRRRKLFGM
jgi:hypothetical protein